MVQASDQDVSCAPSFGGVLVGDHRNRLRTVQPIWPGNVSGSLSWKALLGRGKSKTAKPADPTPEWQKENGWMDFGLWPNTWKIANFTSLCLVLTRKCSYACIKTCLTNMVNLDRLPAKHLHLDQSLLCLTTASQHGCRIIFFQPDFSFISKHWVTQA